MEEDVLTVDYIRRLGVAVIHQAVKDFMYGVSRGNAAMIFGTRWLEDLAKVVGLAPQKRFHQFTQKPRENTKLYTPLCALL